MKRILSILLCLFVLLTGTGCCVVSALTPSADQSSLALDSLSHEEMMSLLKDAFPETIFRGAEGAEFLILSIYEIEKFLDNNETDKLFLSETGDYVGHLIGSFSRPGWDRVPIGFIKTDEIFCNVTVAIEFGEIYLYKINPKTDEMIRIVSADYDVKFVVIF